MDYLPEELEMEDAIFQGIKRWLASEAGQHTQLNDWIEEISKRVYLDSYPTSDDVENIQFVSDSIWNEMDAAMWITRGLGHKSYNSEMWESAMMRLFLEVGDSIGA